MTLKDALLDSLTNNRYIRATVWDSDKFIYFDMFFRNMDGSAYDFTDHDTMCDWEFFSPLKLNTRHTHADLIHIWADTGCSIEQQTSTGGWIVDPNPIWDPTIIYRQQPNSTVLFEYQWVYFENFKMKTIGFFTEEELRISGFKMPISILGYIKRERK